MSEKTTHTINLGTVEKPVNPMSVIDSIAELSLILDEQAVPNDRWFIVPKWFRIIFQRMEQIEFNKAKKLHKRKPRNHIYARYFQRPRRSK